MRTILIQLDTNPQPSVFDRIVAVDAGADSVFSYGGVRPDQVRDLVHGAIFTRGPGELKRTALFIGGNNVTAAERLLEEARRHLLPKFHLTVSILFDPNGCNTTAAAAVRAARRHVDLRQTLALVMGTGPVGQRVARLLARHGARVRLSSDREELAEQASARVLAQVPGAHVEAAVTATLEEVQAAAADRTLIIAAGPAGVSVLPRAAWSSCTRLKTAIDLNAVPPLGIEEITPGDAAVERDGVICYGALAVGGIKMKIHKAAIKQLFERNDQVLDAEAIEGLSQSLA